MTCYINNLLKNNYLMDNNKEELLEKSYSKRISRVKMEKLRKGIHNYIIAGKRYRKQGYSAKQLAEDIGTNTRYISAAIRKYYQCNYAELVNRLRIEDVKVMFADKECTLSIDDIAFLCGFGNRQSFYLAFDKYVGVSPHHYRAAKRKHNVTEEGSEEFKSEEFKSE